MIVKNIVVRKRVITPKSECRSKKWEVIADEYYDDGTPYSKGRKQYCDTKWEAESFAKLIEKNGF